MDRMYSEAETRRIAVDAAQEALKLFAATHPQSATMTFPQAAEAMGLSESTIRRLKPDRVGGKIPYSWVVKQLEGR
jgi:hypothetical protein